MFRHSWFLCGILLTLANPLSAQSPGTFEVGAFGRLSHFDDTLNLDDPVGVGGMLGIFFIRNLALEAEVAYTTTNNTLGLDVASIPIRGRLTYHLPLGGYASTIRLGAGYVHNLYSEDVSFEDAGFTGLIGVRWGLSEKLALQMDGTVDHVPSPDEDRADVYSNLGLQVGVTFLFGNDYGTDNDGANDKDDP